MMKLKSIFLIITSLVFFMVNSAVAQTKAELKKITESVYSYVGIPSGTPGNVFAANAGIIVGKNAVLVVDTLTSAREAKAFMEEIKKVTDKPVRYVVNTHYHLDHALGNSFFSDMGINIISHTKCRESIIAGGEKVLENPAAFGLPADFWKETRIVSPDMAFDHEMIIDLGNLLVKLLYTGIKSHTGGSIIVHVPEQNVLFTGDILFTDFHPYLGEGDLDGWESNLDAIHAMNIKNIIPGHGPLSTNKDIEDMKIYLKIFDKKATELSAVEKDVEKLTLAMLKAVPKRSDGDFIVTMNLKSRYLTNKEQVENK